MTTGGLVNTQANRACSQQTTYNLTSELNQASQIGGTCHSSMPHFRHMVSELH